MNKKLVIIAIACAISIVLGGFNNTVLYGTQYLSTTEGYTYTVGEAVAWWNCNWSYRKNITIDHTKVASDQINFPVLIYRSSDSDLAAHAQADGDDVAFVRICNTIQYDHEIEYYNSSTGELWAWVEIPSLSSNADTIIYMYYGNPSCSSQENKNDVWDSGHHGVWHLNESSGLLEDSTSYENRYANVYGDPTYNVTGKIAGAMDFDGDGDYIRRRNRASLNFGTGDFTLECWVKTEESNARTIISKHKPLTVPDTGYALKISNGKLLAEIADGDEHGLGEGSKTINDGVWHHLVVVFDRDADGIYYVDGEVDKQTDISDWNGDTSNSLHNFLSYTDYALNPTYFNGIVDETRISSGVRSSAWVNTTYQNINDPTNFTSFGSEVGVLSTWSYRKKITIESDLVDEDLINFPVLIYNSSDNDLQNNALSTGNDIMFLNTSVGWTTGTWRDKLDHEIEKFESSTGEIEAWVRIPTLSNSTDTEIYMYYGNTLCTDNRENATGVWDSNYMMVQHLQETGIGTRSDSTSNGNDGTSVGYVEDISIDNGKIDGADGFDGVDDYINVPDDSSLNFTSTMTVSLWVKANENPAQYDAIVTKDEDSWWDDGYGLWFNSISEIRFWVGSDYATQFAKKTSVTTTDWNYVVGTCDGSIIKLYVNKVRGTDGSGAPTAVAATLELGRGTDNLYNLKGWLDEVRISNIERNSSWINATYDNINDISSFLIFDSEEIKNVAPDLSNPNPANGAIGQELNPSLSITANDINANLLNISFWTDASGSWQRLGGYHEGYNGTYNDANASDMNSYNTTYYWSVNCSDATVWTNATYSFTTKEIHTYIVNSANDNKAYKGDTLTWNTFPAGSEFSSSDYDAIDEDDDNYLSEIPGGPGAWRFHRFSFTIEENDDDIIDITVEWKGYAVQTGTYNQYLQWYNVHAGEWGLGDSSTTAGKDTLTKTWTGTFEGGCLDNGILQVAAIPGSSLDNGAELRSYYIVVNVTYIP